MVAPDQSAQPPSRLAVFVHGHHPGAPNWDAICWGRAPDALGRGPAAVLAAIEMGADHLVFGMGGAKSGSPYHVHRTYTALVERLDRLERFTAFRAHPGRAREILTRRVLFAPAANGSTRGELDGLIPVIETFGFTRLALVSSPDHLPRCLRDAHAALAHHPVRLSGVMADTMMSAAPPVVIEQPHRPDRAHDNLHEVVTRLLETDPETRAAALADLSPKLCQD